MRHKMSLSVNYVSDWGVQEALRELFQNAIDWGNWSWSISEAGELCITSHEAGLDNRTLLLGHSVKAEGSIGKFGEGYKLAMLVLCRLGYQCWIENQKELWQPKLINSRTYGCQQLVFDTSPLVRDYPTEGLVFVVQGLTKQNMNDLNDRNLHVHPAPVLHTVKAGKILSTSQAGRMYVGGLFICTLPDFVHGYDFRPDEVKLDRDRRMLGSFDVSWCTSKMWTEANDVKYAASMVKESKPDVAHVVYHEVNTIAEELHDDFVETYGEDAVAVSSQGQAERAREEGHENIVIVSEPEFAVMRRAPNYSYPTPRITKLTPTQILQEYYDSHIMADDFLAIIEESKKWTQ